MLRLIKINIKKINPNTFYVSPQRLDGWSSATFCEAGSMNVHELWFKIRGYGILCAIIYAQ